MNTTDSTETVRRASIRAGTLPREAEGKKASFPRVVAQTEPEGRRTQAGVHGRDDVTRAKLSSKEVPGIKHNCLFLLHVQGYDPKADEKQKKIHNRRQSQAPALKEIRTSGGRQLCQKSVIRVWACKEAENTEVREPGSTFRRFGPAIRPQNNRTELSRLPQHTNSPINYPQKWRDEAGQLVQTSDHGFCQRRSLNLVTIADHQYKPPPGRVPDSLKSKTGCCKLTSTSLRIPRDSGGDGAGASNAHGRDEREVREQLEASRHQKKFQA
ncbi:hypothetical protein BDZ89DRAFT_1198402 [Hymenopellis radicata]|nr:hypothetical protein BDZ89DRAFT_1198402 [Hymenopellis radicata]